MLPPSKLADQIVLRLPDGIRDRIKQVAAENQRSMNAELVYQLKRIYDPLPKDAAP